MRFLKQEDFEAHEARVCINQGVVLADPRRSRHYTEEQYFRSQQEMVERFADIPESLANTVELAKRCNVTLLLGKSFLPRFPVPSGFTIENYLSKVAKEGLDDRLNISFDSSELVPERRPYDLRLQTELKSLIKWDLPGISIVADFTLGQRKRAGWSWSRFWP